MWNESCFFAFSFGFGLVSFHFVTSIIVWNRNVFGRCWSKISLRYEISQNTLNVFPNNIDQFLLCFAKFRSYSSLTSFMLHFQDRKMTIQKTLAPLFFSLWLAKINKAFLGFPKKKNTLKSVIWLNKCFRLVFAVHSSKVIVLGNSIFPHVFCHAGVLASFFFISFDVWNSSLQRAAVATTDNRTV